ncbi:malonate decarboxylase holo-ACP synthase [Paraburkholderia sp. C35]|uniref:malonate decarboxylase holo-ACP synthase n=1 Tax=Paraburkholderia sp. C35 TaxID=2126993 RepID=UPI000D6903B5|nr:malonate decarboxylase holo-ACP synthase [Paraburkholderia sp. C35]
MRVCAAAPFAAHEALAAGDSRWQAHDIVRLRRLESFDSEPTWVRDAFARAPFAVVRRAQAADGFVAIGVRGVARNERYGTWTRVDDIEAMFAPEALSSTHVVENRAALPALLALDALRHDTSGLGGFVWGPTGSVGFELATGKPTVTSGSDLDLLIRIPNYLSRAQAQQIQSTLDAHASQAGIRIDAQLETPSGGVALAEYSSGKARVMVRSASGPRLVADPWTL